MSNAEPSKGLEILSQACVNVSRHRLEITKQKIRLERRERTKETRRKAVKARTKPTLAASPKICPHNSNRKRYNCKLCKKDTAEEVKAHRETVKAVERAIREDQERASVAAQGEPKQQD
jgi:hypothetical protein